MILIWANFNAQSFINMKLSMQCSEHFFYVSTCSQQHSQIDLIYLGTYSYFWKFFFEPVKLNIGVTPFFPYLYISPNLICLKYIFV